MRWPIESLGNAITEAKVGFACGEEAEDGVFQIRMNNITKEGVLDLSKIRRVPRPRRNWEPFQLRAGDVLFNATNSPDLVGKTAVFENYSEPTVFSNHFVRLRPDEKRLDSSFLARWLQFQFQNSIFRNMCRQWVNQATVGRNALLALRIPLPPLAEQRRIACVLDQVYALRGKRRAAVARLDELTRSIFLDIFDSSREMPVGSLGEHLSFLTSGGRGWAQFYSNKGQRFIRSLDIRMNKIDDRDAVYVTPPSNAEARRTTVKRGDVLLTITGSRIGRVSAVPEELEGAHISQHVAILRSCQDQILPEFLSFFLSLDVGGQRQIASAQYGQTKPGLNFQQIREFKIPTPTLSLQNEFAERLAVIESLKTAHRAHLAELDALFASLQYRAFRGEL